METKQQIDHLIELAIIQRSELKRLTDQLPVLRGFMLEQINATIEDMEPQLRSDLIEFCDEKTNGKIEEIRAFFNEAKDEFKTKSNDFFVQLEQSVIARYGEFQKELQGRYESLLAQKEVAFDFAEDARKHLEIAAKQETDKIPAQVSAQVTELVDAAFARFPRAGELDQLRKEFAEPRGLNPRGKWKSAEVYQKLDLVAFNGDSYVSNVNDNTERPGRSSEVWTLSAARGQGGGGGGITSLNDIIGTPTSDLVVIGAEENNFVQKTLTAGTNVTLTETPTTITIAASGDSSSTAQIVTATAVNAESVAITRGQVVYAYAATGNLVSVKLASNSSESTSSKTFGVVSDNSIAAGATGTVTCIGVVDKLALGTYSEGDTVYLSATPGAFTATKPYAPNNLVYVGIVERANNGNGELYVKIQNGYELDEIHDVQINSPRLSGQTIIYDATNSLWKNARLTAGTNISVTNADASVTIAFSGTLPVTSGGTGSTTASGARTNLGLVIGTDVLAPTGSGASLTGITATQVGLGNVTNDTQTKAAIVPNTAPSSGQILVGNAGGTAYAPVSSSGDVTVSSTGAFTIGSSKVTNTMLAGSIDLTTKVTGALPIANGGTAGTTAADARTNLGLGSIATQAASNVSLTGGSASNLKVFELIEDGTVSATAATGALNYDVKTQTVLYYTSNASGNWTLNIRGDGSTSLDSLMATGDSITLAFLVTQGSTAYYPTALTVDGASVTPKWQGGTAPTAGNASGIDGYSYTVIKTASATFTVLAAQTQFK